MMPFSVLRMWFLGLISWAVLAAGIYLFYEWANGLGAPEAVSIEVPVSASSSDSETGRRTLIVQHDRRGGIPFLIGALALLLLSTGGIGVLLRILGSVTSAPEPPIASRIQCVKRPDGSELYVEHVGPETEPVLLFTHGWTLDRSDWDGARAALGERYHLVFWDLAGLGRSRSPRNADHSLEKMAADLEAVLNEASTGPVILVGHSIGGMIQQTFSRLFPEQLNQRVRGLVLVHTTYTNPAKTALGSPILRALQKPVLEPLTYLTIWLAPLMWLSNWQSYWNGSLHLSTRLTSFAGKQTWKQIDAASRLQARAWPAVVGRGMLAMTEFDEQATLPQVFLPVLIIAGADDRLTKPEASGVLAQLLPDAKLQVLMPAGHFGHWEHPSEFHTALSTFADSITAVANMPQESAAVR
jgi:pimeloyl-ACP methyl ester carboxylesterase